MQRAALLAHSLRSCRAALSNVEITTSAVQAVALSKPSVSYSSWWPRGWSSTGSGDKKKEVDSAAQPEASTSGAGGAAGADGAGPGDASSGSGAAPPPPEVPSREELLALVSEKDKLLDEAYKKVEESKDRVLRAYADQENMLDRTRRQAEQARQFALQGFVKALLDVADNLERALQAVPKGVEDGSAVVEPEKMANLLKNLTVGMSMTEKTLHKVFAQHGVERYVPVGEVFDPNQHQALFEVPAPGQIDRSILQVVKSGYRLNGRVIRPADVGVVTGGRKPEAQDGQPGQPGPDAASKGPGSA